MVIAHAGSVSRLLELWPHRIPRRIVAVGLVYMLISALLPWFLVSTPTYAQ